MGQTGVARMFGAGSIRGSVAAPARREVQRGNARDFKKRSLGASQRLLHGGPLLSGDSNIDCQWFDRELISFKPRERLLVSEWTENYRVLGDQSEEKGPMRLRRTPYMVPIMDQVLNPSVLFVVLCKSAQIAGTEAMISVIGYFAHQEPCPKLF